MRLANLICLLVPREILKDTNDKLPPSPPPFYVHVYVFPIILSRGAPVRKRKMKLLVCCIIPDAQDAQQLHKISFDALVSLSYVFFIGRRAFARRKNAFPIHSWLRRPLVASAACFSRARGCVRVTSSSFRWTFTHIILAVREVRGRNFYIQHVCVCKQASAWTCVPYDHGENIAILSRVRPLKFDWHVINSDFVASAFPLLCVCTWIFSGRAVYEALCENAHFDRYGRSSSNG